MKLINGGENKFEPISFIALLLGFPFIIYGVFLVLSTQDIVFDGMAALAAGFMIFASILVVFSLLLVFTYGWLARMQRRAKDAEKEYKIWVRISTLLYWTYFVILLFSLFSI